MTASPDDFRRLRADRRSLPIRRVGPPLPGRLALYQIVNGAGEVRFGKGKVYDVLGRECEGCSGDLLATGEDEFYAAPLGVHLAPAGYRVAGWGDFRWSFRAPQTVNPPNPPATCELLGTGCVMPTADLLFHPETVTPFPVVEISWPPGSSTVIDIPTSDTVLSYYSATLTVGHVTFFGSWVSDTYSSSFFGGDRRLLLVCYGGFVSFLSLDASVICTSEGAWDFCDPNHGWYPPPFGQVFGSDSTCHPFYLAVVDRHVDGTDGTRRGTITPVE